MVLCLQIDDSVSKMIQWYNAKCPKHQEQIYCPKRSTKHKVVMCKNHFVSLDIEQIPTMVNIVRELPKHSGESDLDQVSRTTLGLRNYIGSPTANTSMLYGCVSIMVINFNFLNLKFSMQICYSHRMFSEQLCYFVR